MPLVPDTLAAAEDLNTTLQDIATALTGSIASDGSVSYTGPVNYNNQNLTGVGSMTATTVTATTGALTTLTVSGGANINYLTGSLNANGQNITGAGSVTGTTAQFSNGTFTNITVTNVANINALGQSLNANGQNITNIATCSAGTFSSGTFNGGTFNGLFNGSANNLTINGGAINGSPALNIWNISEITGQNNTISISSHLQMLTWSIYNANEIHCQVLYTARGPYAAGTAALNAVDDLAAARGKEVNLGEAVGVLIAAVAALSERQRAVPAPAFP